MKKYIMIMLLIGQLAFTTSGYAQNIAINQTGNQPDTSAMLDVSSTNKGFLAPRMTTLQQNAIPIPALGLLVFNTDDKVFKVNTVAAPGSPVWIPMAFGNSIASLAGDGTTSGSGTATLTLATVNSSTSPLGSSTAIPTITANAKGLVQSISTNPVIAPAGTLSGTALNSSVTGSSLTSVGTLTKLTVTNPIAGSITGSAGTTVTFTGNLEGDVTGTQAATIVGKINGTS